MASENETCGYLKLTGQFRSDIFTTTTRHPFVNLKFKKSSIHTFSQSPYITMRKVFIVLIFIYVLFISASRGYCENNGGCATTGKTHCCRGECRFLPICHPVDDGSCVSDNDCEDDAHWCCNNHDWVDRYLQLHEFDGLCVSASSSCTDIDKPSAHAERELILKENDVNEMVWNALRAMMFAVCIITVCLITYYCLMIHHVPSRSVKVRWQKVNNPQSEEEELIEA
eukprot:261225_1